MILRVLACAFLMVAAPAAADVILADGALPLSIAALSVPPDPFGELSIVGANGGAEPVTLVLRIDDDRSVDYRRRVNE